MQRHCAVVTRSYSNPEMIELLGNIVGVNSINTEAEDATFVVHRWPDDFNPLHRTQSVVSNLSKLLLVSCHAFKADLLQELVLLPKFCFERSHLSIYLTFNLSIFVSITDTLLNHPSTSPFLAVY
mgnify:CR=1 FL=1